MRDVLFRATLDLTKLDCKFIPEKPASKDKYITASLFRTFNHDMDRFGEYMEGFVNLVKNVTMYLPTWRILLFITKNSFLLVSDYFSIISPNVTLCIVNDSALNVKGIIGTKIVKRMKQWEGIIDEDQIQEDVKKMSILEDDKKGYIPTTFRYLPYLQPETFDFVTIFASVDLDVCFTEIYASLLSTWVNEEQTPLFYVRMLLLEKDKVYTYQEKWHLQRTARMEIIPLGGAVAFRMEKLIEDFDFNDIQLSTISHINWYPEHGVDERVLQIIFNSIRGITGPCDVYKYGWHEDGNISVYSSYSKVYDKMLDSLFTTDKLDIVNYILENSLIKIHSNYNSMIIKSLIMDTLRSRKPSLDKPYLLGESLLGPHKLVIPEKLRVILKKLPDTKNQPFGIDQLIFCKNFRFQKITLTVFSKFVKNFEELENKIVDLKKDKKVIKNLEKIKEKKNYYQIMQQVNEVMTYFSLLTKRQKNKKFEYDYEDTLHLYNLESSFETYVRASFVSACHNGKSYFYVERIPEYKIQLLYPDNAL